MANLDDRGSDGVNRPLAIRILVIQRELHRLQLASSHWKIGATFDTLNQLPTFGRIAKLKSKIHDIGWISGATFHTRVLGS